jgi:hypothetical protein
MPVIGTAPAPTAGRPAPDPARPPGQGYPARPAPSPPPGGTLCAPRGPGPPAPPPAREASR